MAWLTLAAWVVPGGAATAGAAPASAAGPGQGWQQGIAAAGDWEVLYEHLLVRPLPGAQEPDSFEVVDLLRLVPRVPEDARAPSSPPAASLVVLPLPSGYRGLRVLAGLVPQSVVAESAELRAVVEPPAAGQAGQEGQPGQPGQRGQPGQPGQPAQAGKERLQPTSVVVRYQLSARRMAHAWTVWRPYPVREEWALVHPQAPVALAGGQPAGTVLLEGEGYRAFVARQAVSGQALFAFSALPGTDASARDAPAARGVVSAPLRPRVFAVAAVGLLAALLAVAARARALRTDVFRARVLPARSGRPARQAARLAARLAELEAEWEAGFLERSAYEQTRRRLLQQLGEPVGHD